MTQGKCVECSVKYEWNTPQLFRESYCVICRRKLKLTSRQLHTNESFNFAYVGKYFVWHRTPYCIPDDEEFEDD